MTKLALGVFVVLRAFTILVSDLPTITPDEYGSWAIATRLALGDGLLSMQDMPSYPLVPGLILVPLEWLPFGPTTTYRLALVLGSAMVAGAAELARRSVRLLRPDQPLAAAAAFALVLLSPALLTTTSFTWAEPTVVLCWATLCWATVALTHHAIAPSGATAPAGPAGRSGSGASASASLPPIVVGSLAAGIAPFVHGRLMAAPIVWAVLLAVVAQRAVPVRRATVGGVGLMIVTWWVLSRVEGAVRASLWTDAIGHDTSLLRSELTSPEVWWTVFGVAVGQLWYAVVASFGLAAFGVVGLVAGLRGRYGTRVQLVTGFVSVLAASNLALSTIAMSAGTFRAGSTGSTGGVDGRLRWDHLVYGRYNDAAIVVLSVVGLLWLWSARHRLTAAAASIAGLAVAAMALVLLRAGQLPIEGRVDVNVAGVSMVDVGQGATSIVLWTGVGLVAMFLVVQGARRGPRPLAAVVVVLLCVTAALAGLRTATVQRSISTPDVIGPVGAAPSDHDVAAIASDTATLPFLRLGAFGLQHQLVSAGWTFEFTDTDSTTLADTADGLDRLGLVVLDAGDRPGPGWSAVVEFEGSVLWRRD